MLYKFEKISKKEEDKNLESYKQINKDKALELAKEIKKL